MATTALLAPTRLASPAGDATTRVRRARTATIARARRDNLRKAPIAAAAASSTTTTELPPPALANPDACSRASDYTSRRGAVPYKDAAVDVDIMVNDGARAAIAAAGAERFVSLIDPSNPKLLRLLRVMEDGWDAIGVRNKNAGHHSLWPEAFEAGRALLEEAFPEECDPKFGGEVLSGVAFVGAFVRRPTDPIRARHVIEKPPRHHVLTSPIALLRPRHHFSTRPQATT